MMKVFFCILLAGSVLLNLILLLTRPTTPPPNESRVPETAVERVREVAELCGGDAERLRRQSVYETLADIREALRDAEAASPAVLGKDDLALLDNYLDNKPQLLALIKRQNSFAASLRGKRLLILPEREGE